jgi:hypothetical protein
VDVFSDLISSSRVSVSICEYSERAQEWALPKLIGRNDFRVNSNKFPRTISLISATLDGGRDENSNSRYDSCFASPAGIRVAK